jgi:hypothetical protein
LRCSKTAGPSEDMFSSRNSARQGMSTRFGGASMQVHTAATLLALVTLPPHTFLRAFALAPVRGNILRSNAPVLQGHVRMAVVKMLPKCILEVLKCLILRASAFRPHILYQFPVRLNPAVTTRHGRNSPSGPLLQCLHRHQLVLSLW